MANRTAEFTNADGVRLKARIELPVGPVRAVALFAHCFTCTMQSHAATRVTMALATLGIATMRFDFTGLGGSEGDFANAGFAADVADIVAAADHLRDTLAAPTLLIGHSLGGAAILAAAARVPEARAVVTIGAPFDPAHVLHRIEGDLAAIERDGEGEVKIGGRAFRISADFLARTKGEMPAAQIAGLKRALLVLHAPTDQTVGIENARQIFEAARHPKSFVALDGADHLLTRLSDAQYVATLIAAWVEPYLDPLTARSGRRRRRGARRQHRRQVCDAAADPRHELIADEPVAIGGGRCRARSLRPAARRARSCTAMTIKLVAARENIPLRGVTVRLTHDRNHGTDCDHCPEAGARIEAIDRTLMFEGELDDAQRARLLVIADKCPVHRTLTGDLHIHTRLEG